MTRIRSYGGASDAWKLRKPRVLAHQGFARIDWRGTHESAILSHQLIVQPDAGIRHHSARVIGRVPSVSRDKTGAPCRSGSIS